MSLLPWTSRSTRSIAEEMTRRGLAVSHVTVARCLAQLGYSLQANVKVLEGPPYTAPKGLGGGVMSCRGGVISCQRLRLGVLSPMKTGGQPPTAFWFALQVMAVPPRVPAAEGKTACLCG
jgi:hypothetical protein